VDLEPKAVARAWTQRTRWLGPAWERLVDPRLLRAVSPAVLALVVLLPFCFSVRNIVGSTLYSDTTLLQYTGWCLLHGERPYIDWITTDGPANYFIQAFLQLFTGTSESAYRCADLVFTVCGFGLVGAILAPSLPGSRGLVRFAWWLTAASMWVAFMVSTDQMLSCQREGYYAVLGSMSLAAIYTSPLRSRRWATVALTLGVMVTTFLLFAKHTTIIYWSSAVAMIVLLPSNPERPLRFRLAIIGVGTTVVFGVALTYLALRGSLRPFLFWYFEYNFTVYRFFERQGAGSVLHDRSEQFAFAMILAAAGVVAVCIRALPWRALPVALAPLAYGVAAVLQQKGWVYHFIPLYGSANLLYLVGLSAVWEPATRARWGDGRRLAAVVLLAFVAFEEGQRVGQGLWLSKRVKVEEAGRFGNPAWDAAAFLRENTGANDRVFYWGDDPNILLQAQRRPASPHITTWTATFLREVPTEASRDPPTATQREHIGAMEEELRKDACAHALDAHAPAMMFSDGGHISEDAVADFATFCPDLLPLLESEYQEPKRIAHIRIYLRKPPSTS
jgi:hypothetical protein